MKRRVAGLASIAEPITHINVAPKGVKEWIKVFMKKESRSITNKSHQLLIYCGAYIGRRILNTGTE